jgi:hypothetical protein
MKLYKRLKFLIFQITRKYKYWKKLISIKNTWYVRHDPLLWNYAFRLGNPWFPPERSYSRTLQETQEINALAKRFDTKRKFKTKFQAFFAIRNIPCCFVLENQGKKYYINKLRNTRL